MVKSVRQSEYAEKENPKNGYINGTDKAATNLADFCVS
jgi:hypothetical protein